MCFGWFDSVWLGLLGLRVLLTLLFRIYIYIYICRSVLADATNNVRCVVSMKGNFVCIV